jgi:hypothetical protein
MNPIKPAVIKRGNKLGIRDIIIILKFLNMYAINIDIRTIANESERIRFLTKKYVPC